MLMSVSRSSPRAYTTLGKEREGLFLTALELNLARVYGVQREIIITTLFFRQNNLPIYSIYNAKIVLL